MSNKTKGTSAAAWFYGQSFHGSVVPEVEPVRHCVHCDGACLEGMTGADYFACDLCFRESARAFGPVGYVVELCQFCQKRERNEA